MVKDICILRGRTIDEQEKLIIKALIRNPRSSDNQISKTTKVPVRTVYRKEKIRRGRHYTLLPKY